MIGIYMFFTALLMLLIGFPVAFPFAGVALVFGIYSEGFADGMEDGFIEHLIQGIGLFDMMPYRIYSIMENTILMAIPLFIFMGIILQKTKLAEQLLESMGTLFGSVRGGLAISTILVGALLAASTGVVGASVVAMGVISLPVMLKYGYCKKLSTGVICASGTLGQIIPPSIVLIILGDVLGVAVGDLFKAAVVPGLVLVGSYIAYVLIVSYFNKDLAPAMPIEENIVKKDIFFDDILDNVLDILMIEDENIITTNKNNIKLHVNFKLFTIVIKNLIDNAIKYSNDNKVNINIEQKTISVSNKGESLKHDIEKYYEPFFNNNQHKANKQNSFGLGLYIIKNILDVHGFKLTYLYQDGINIFTIKL